MITLLNTLTSPTARRMLREYDGPNTLLHKPVGHLRPWENLYEYSSLPGMEALVEEVGKAFQAAGITVVCDIVKEDKSYWDRDEYVERFGYTMTYRLEEK